MLLWRASAGALLGVTIFYFYAVKFNRMKGEELISFRGRHMKCMPVRKQGDNTDT